MRNMMEDCRRPDKGAAALIVALCVVVFCGAAAISVDYGHLVYEKRRVQNAADAAARAIALDCARKLPCEIPNANATGSAFGTSNAGAGSGVNVSLDKTRHTVRVTVDRTTDFAFGPVIGVDSGSVSASAEASWGAVPVDGRPILPFAVPLCSVTQNAPPSDSDDGPDVTYRTDLLNQVIEIADVVSSQKNALNGVLNPLTGLIGQIVKDLLGAEVRGTLDKVLDPLLDADSTDACGGDSDIVAAQGGFWITSLEGAVPGTLNGLFPSSSKPCELRNISTEVLVGQLVSGLRSSECFSLLGTEVEEGDTVLIPVYEPGSGTTDTGGFLGTPLSIDAGVRLDGNNVAQLSVNIVGFVPFTVTGWDNGLSGASQNQTSYFDEQCNNIDLGTHVLEPLTAANGSITSLLTLLDSTTTQINKLPTYNVLTWLLSTVVNAVTSTLNTLLPGLGDKVKQLTSTSDRTSVKSLIGRLKDIVNGVSTDLNAISVGCQAVRGHFTRQTGTDPAFDWDAPPAGYPAALLDLFVSVKLID